MEHRAFSGRDFGFVVGLLVMGVCAFAQPLYLGEASRDYEMDTADVISVYNVVINPTNTPGLVRLLADANNDRVVDENDVVYVSDILLGLEFPLPLVTEPIALPAGFVFLGGEESEITEANVVQSGAVSFLYLPPVQANVSEVDVVQTGASSFLYLPPVTAEVTDRDAVQMGASSFLYLPAVVADIKERDAVQAGAPSFLYLPTFAVEATEDSAVQQGTPSFDRQ